MINQSDLYTRFYPVIGFKAHGRIGHLFVFQQQPWGRQVRRFVYPYDPKTAGQLFQRNLMRDAVANWQAFDESTKQFYNEDWRTLHMSGYNRYIQLYLKVNSV